MCNNVYNVTDFEFCTLIDKILFIYLFELYFMLTNIQNMRILKYSSYATNSAW